MGLDLINININNIDVIITYVSRILIWETNMASDWQELTKLTGGKAIVVERVRLAESGIGIDGAFELPPLAKLTGEDQVFVAVFVRCHGSIKQMEQVFGISYPTVKNRLRAIVGKLDSEFSVPSPNAAILEQVARTLAHCHAEGIVHRDLKPAT